MPKVFWFDEARTTFDNLPDRVKQETEQRLKRM
jgi:hypothetical protein